MDQPRLQCRVVIYTNQNPRTFRIYANRMKYVHLSNAFGLDVYPRNKGGEFCNYLNQELILKGGSSWSVCMHDMYYIPNTWFNIRPTNNTIHIKVSNVESGGGNSEIGSQFTAQIAAGDYVDGVVLMQAVINTRNQALFDYFKSSGADGHYYRQDLYSLGSNAHIPWLRRQHNWAREQPSTHVVIDDSKPKALQEAKEKLHIPSDWDP